MQDVLKPRSPLLLALVLSVSAAGCGEDDLGTSEQDILDEAEYRSGDPEFCEQLITLEHSWKVGDGAKLRVVERFTPRSLLRGPRRAILMLPGTLVTGEMWDMETESEFDFNALDRAAREGFFAYAVTYEGYPGSTQPDDGADVTAERTLDQLGIVVEKIRKQRGIARVDLMGASFGSSLATALGGTMSPIDPDHIGRIVLQALVYKSVTPLFAEIFFSPEVQQLLLNAPGGYIMTIPDMYGLIVFAADPAAAAWSFENFPDVYATGPTLEGFDLPLFDGEFGQAPALQFWGTADLITPELDVQQFQAEYGGPSELRVMPGAGHAPYIAEPELAEAFWSETFDFLAYDPWVWWLACEP